MSAGIVVAGLYLAAGVFRESTRARINETNARQRVIKAENNLGKALLGEPYIAVMGDPAQLAPDSIVPTDDDEPADVTVLGVTGVIHGHVNGSVERRDDRLTLAALWNVTHSRLDLYHQIVTRQAKRSFMAAQLAIGVGFILLVGFAILAVRAKTPAGAISVGSLGAVGAAFAAYIGRTFIRSQESEASHLRAYFDQPLELSRYLAAERLLADDARLSDEQHAATLSILVQSIATAGHQNSMPGKKKDGTTTA